MIDYRGLAKAGIITDRRCEKHVYDSTEENRKSASGTDVYYIYDEINPADIPSMALVTQTKYIKTIKTIVVVGFVLEMIAGIIAGILLVL